MEENFETITRKYYCRLREPFMRKLTQRYPSLRLDMAEDLYQETFLAVQDNIKRGRVRADTDWNAYILTIGMNMAAKLQRHLFVTGVIENDEYVAEDSGNGALTRKVEESIRKMSEEDTALCNDREVLSVLGNELDRSPELCNKIIRLFYYNGASMKEIAEETGLKNAQTAKARKSQYMKDFAGRLTASLRRAGFDLTPKSCSNRRSAVAI